MMDQACDQGSLRQPSSDVLGDELMKAQGQVREASLTALPTHPI
jgi:hypothetical protein